MLTFSWSQDCCESEQEAIDKISKKNYYSQLKEDKEYTMLFNN